MAAEHASDNEDALEATLGRDANGTDLYMAHFLGLGGAKQFLSQVGGEPRRQRRCAVPAGRARQSRRLLHAAGQPRSLTQIYERFGAKLGSVGETAAANRDFATRVLGLNGDTTVVNGSESAEDALAGRTRPRAGWRSGRPSTCSARRPTPRGSPT